MRLICGCLIAIQAVSAAGQDRPLPDYATFMAEARKRLEADDVRQSEYVYVETQREQKLDASRRVHEGNARRLRELPVTPERVPLAAADRQRRQTRAA